MIDSTSNDVEVTPVRKLCTLYLVCALVMAGCDTGGEPTATDPFATPTVHVTSTSSTVAATTTTLVEPEFMSAPFNLDYRQTPIGSPTQWWQVPIVLNNPEVNSRLIMEQFLVAVLSQRARDQFLLRGEIPPARYVPTVEEVKALKAEIDANGGVLHNFFYPINHPDYEELVGFPTHLGVSSATDVDLNQGITFRLDPEPNSKNFILFANDQYFRFEVSDTGALQMFESSNYQALDASIALGVLLELLSLTDSAGSYFTLTANSALTSLKFFNPERATMDTALFSAGDAIEVGGILSPPPADTSPLFIYDCRAINSPSWTPDDCEREMRKEWCDAEMRVCGFTAWAGPPPLPPAGDQPDDPQAAEAEIRANFALLYDNDVAFEDKAERLLDDTEGVQEARDRRSDVIVEAAMTAVRTITRVVFVSPTEAWFKYDLTTIVADFPGRFGIAYLIDAQWKIARAVICQELALAGSPCDPPVKAIAPPSSG